MELSHLTSSRQAGSAWCRQPTQGHQQLHEVNTILEKLIHLKRGKPQKKKDTKFLKLGKAGVPEHQHCWWENDATGALLPITKICNQAAPVWEELMLPWSGVTGEASPTQTKHEKWAEAYWCLSKAKPVSKSQNTVFLLPQESPDTAERQLF